MTGQSVVCCIHYKGQTIATHDPQEVPNQPATMGIGGKVEKPYTGGLPSVDQVNRTAIDRDDGLVSVVDTKTALTVVHLIDYMTMVMRVFKSISLASTCLPSQSKQYNSFALFQKGSRVYTATERKRKPVVQISVDYSNKNNQITNVKSVNVVSLGSSLFKMDHLLQRNGNGASPFKAKTNGMGSKIEILLPDMQDAELFVSLVRDGEQLKKYVKENNHLFENMAANPAANGLVCQDRLMMTTRLNDITKLYLYRLEPIILIACHRFIANLKSDLCELRNPESLKFLIVCKDDGRSVMKLKEQTYRKVQRLLRCIVSVKNEIIDLTSNKEVDTTPLFLNDFSGELLPAQDMEQQQQRNPEELRFLDHIFTLFNNIPKSLFDYYLFNVFSNMLHYEMGINKTYVMKSNGNYEADIVVAKLCMKLLSPELQQLATSCERNSSLYFVPIQYGEKLFTAAAGKPLTVTKMLGQISSLAIEKETPVCFQIYSSDMDVLSNVSLGLEFGRELVKHSPTTTPTTDVDDVLKIKTMVANLLQDITFQRNMNYTKSKFVNAYYNLSDISRMVPSTIHALFRILFGDDYTSPIVSRNKSENLSNGSSEETMTAVGVDKNEENTSQLIRCSHELLLAVKTICCCSSSIFHKPLSDKYDVATTNKDGDGVCEEWFQVDTNGEFKKCNECNKVVDQNFNTTRLFILSIVMDNWATTTGTGLSKNDVLQIFKPNISAAIQLTEKNKSVAVECAMLINLCTNVVTLLYMSRANRFAYGHTNPPPTNNNNRFNDTLNSFPM